MIYDIELIEDANADIEKFKKSGDIKTLLKIDQFFNELRNHPANRTGKPIKLKH